MPGLLSLSSGGGFLLLSSNAGLLSLSAPDPVAPNDSTLYQTDLIEDAFQSILQAALPGVQITKKRETVASVSPRVEIQFTAQQNKDRRYLRYPNNSFVPAQPLNAWDYVIQFTVVTNRNNNASGWTHNQIVGIVCLNAQYFTLLTTWDTAVAPYHAITSIWESAPREDTFNTEQDLDETRLNFGGMVNIRNSAWPVL